MAARPLLTDTAGNSFHSQLQQGELSGNKVYKRLSDQLVTPVTVLACYR